MSTAQLGLLELFRRPTSLGRMRPKRESEEYLAGLWAGEFVKGNVPSFVQGVRVLPQEGQWILVLPEEGVGITWGREPFEAAVHLEEGTRNLERRDVESRERGCPIRAA